MTSAYIFFLSEVQFPFVGNSTSGEFFSAFLHMLCIYFILAVRVTSLLVEFSVRVLHHNVQGFFTFRYSSIF